MAGNGYSFVSELGFRAFGQELEAGPWGQIGIKEHDTDAGIAKAPLAEAPMMVGWKLRVLWGIRSLATAGGPDLLAEHDTEWDSAQRAFHLGVAAAEEHKNPAVRAAAGRVRAALLAGSGTSQTTLGYELEVDFGRDQVQRAKKSPLAEDIEVIGAGDHITRIDEATKAFAAALGRDKNKGRAPSRARRVRAALVACSAAFNGVHDEIAWAMDHTEDRDERARLEALLAPLQALLDRYPSVAAARAADQEAEADAAGDTADKATDGAAKAADPAEKSPPKPA